MANPTLGFSDYAAEQGDIERRRKYAEALQQQSMQPLETRMAGGWAVPISWTQGLAKGLQAYSGRKGMDQATAEQKALGQRARDEMTAWAQQMPQGTPAQPERYTGEAGTVDEMYNPAVAAKQPTQQEMMAWALKGTASGNPMAAQMAGPFMAQALKMSQPHVVGPDATLMTGTGDVIGRGAPRTVAPPAPSEYLQLVNQLNSLPEGDPNRQVIQNRLDFLGRDPSKQATPFTPGRTREVQKGTEKVTEELQQNGQWKEIGRGPAFARQVAPVVNVGNTKLPAGWRYTADGQGMEFIPGGPADPKYVGSASAAKAGGTTTGRENAEISLDPVKAANGANKILSTIEFNPQSGDDKVSKLIKQSTSGLVQQGAAGAVGALTGRSTSGKNAIQTLATYANQLTMDLMGGKLGSGISNADRDFVVGQLGDVANASTPSPARLAAWKSAVDRLQKISSGQINNKPPAGTPANSSGVDSLLDKYK